MESNEPRFEVLEGLPPYGAPALPFPATGEGKHREGFVVRFYPTSGEVWVGNFQGGISSLCVVEDHPDGHRLVVISCGQGYIVDPNDWKSVEEIGGWYERTIRLSELLILVTPIDFEAIGPEGRRWRTRRVSWDGMRDLELDPPRRTITGEAWTWADDAWIPFALDLESGVVKGGSYNGPD